MLVLTSSMLWNGGKIITSNIKFLSRMAIGILAILISIVASKSIFHATGRVIDEFRSRLTEESIASFIYGEDWLRNKNNLKKKKKV